MAADEVISFASKLSKKQKLVWINIFVLDLVL